MSASDVRFGQDSFGAYAAEERLTLAEVPGLRVRRLKLAAGQCVPWHYHNEIKDTFFCMKGPMWVITRNPDAVNILLPGDTVEVPAGRIHFATGANGRECEFIVIQGVGAYDYVSIAD